MLEVALIMISKQTRSIINVSPISLPTELPMFTDLICQIHSICPLLSPSSFKLYWRLNDEIFYKIKNFLSYLTVLKLMGDNTTVYLVLDDYDENCIEITGFLRTLDLQELKSKQERRRDIYDAKIVRSGKIKAETYKTDEEIILYAIRNLDKVQSQNSDLDFKSKIIEAVEKGWPNQKALLTLPKNEKIHRAPKLGKNSKSRSTSREKSSKNSEKSEENEKQRKR